MLTEYVNSIVRLGNGGAFEPTLGDGRFTMVNKTRAVMELGGVKYASNLELATHFQVAKAKFDVIKPVARSNFYGYNKKFIDESGVYDPLRAIDEYSRTVPGMRLGRDDLRALSLTDNKTDSQEAYIYNMLVSWLKARLYVDMKGSDNKFTVKYSSFKDTHVGYDINDSYGIESVEVNLGPPNPTGEAAISLEFRDTNNFWSKPYVLKYSNNSMEQGSFYLAHVLGSNGTSGLSADIQIDALDFNELLLDPVGSFPTGAFNIFADFWAKPNVIWLWIMDYVRLNRVEQEFASAFELLGALATQPLPSYHESILWSKSRTVVNMSKFSPTRARVPANLTGEPNVHDLNAQQFTFDEEKSPAGFITASAVLNYAFWIGIYGMVSNFAEDCSDWTDAFISSDAELGILSTVEARPAMISLVTGKETNSCFSNNCFLTYDLSGMYGVKQLIVDEKIDPNHPGVILFDTVPAFVSGSLLMGAVATDYPVLKHLEPHQHIKVERDGLLGAREAAMLANSYRLFGNDVIIEHFRSAEVYPTYANSEECVIATYELFGRTRTFDIMRVSSSYKRTGRTYEIPDATHVRTYGECKLTMDMPVLAVCGWKQRKTVHRPKMMLDSRRVATKFMVGATSGFEKTRFAVYNRRNVMAQGFHEAKAEMAPALPLVRGSAVSTAPIEPVQEQEPANAVE
ncbi:capsid protein [Xanthophyllomyces dendrorhous virus L1B]|uniref:Capsid protein n=1 Tax=Xanthophyllomyces dendrorhous virus L1B TaxID=1167691 RepID=H9XW61_9VIRU|nr:capsid protein [Xanthophyllomyces dendrorhous virus L1B]AFH09413.1 capsid protein [Xanthophyllomyces dendrorhous virus L1B]